MKPKVNDINFLNISPNQIQTIRKSILVYLLSAVIVLAICYIFGWRSTENIGTGFIYGSFGLVLFGALILAGNTVPAQLSKLSIPKYAAPSLKRRQDAERDVSQIGNEGIRLFCTTLISGVLLLGTGLLIKSFV